MSGIVLALDAVVCALISEGGGLPPLPSPFVDARPGLISSIGRA